MEYRKVKLLERTEGVRFQGQTVLEQLAVSSRVAKDYQKRISELKAFARAHHLSLTRKNSFDLVCCKFVNNMFSQGFDLQDGTKSLAAIIDAYPDYGPKHMLPRTRRALQGWSKVEPQMTRPPLPWHLVAAMAVHMLQKNRTVSAAAILLMFTAYLRPGESLDVQSQDLVPPMPGSRHYSLLLHPAERHQQSKVGLSDESLLLDSPVLPWLGKALHRLARGQSYLLNISYANLVKDWKAALARLGLSADHCVLYQLRHAGPSHDRCHRLRSLPEVKQRGRWASDSSVRRYEAHARISQEFFKLPQKTQQLCLEMEPRLHLEAQKRFHLS